MNRDWLTTKTADLSQTDQRALAGSRSFGSHSFKARFEEVADVAGPTVRGGGPVKSDVPWSGSRDVPVPRLWRGLGDGRPYRAPGSWSVRRRHLGRWTSCGGTPSPEHGIRRSGGTNSACIRTCPEHVVAPVAAPYRETPTPPPRPLWKPLTSSSSLPVSHGNLVPGCCHPSIRERRDSTGIRQSRQMTLKVVPIVSQILTNESTAPST